MNLALAVLVIAAGACRIRVNHLVNAESMNIKKTSGIKEVALTFDDGPSPECTKDLLEGLKERNVKATFCNRRESRGISGFDKENSG